MLFGAVHARMGGHVKWLISGGAALPRETQERFAGLGLQLTEGYGLTEAAPVLTVVATRQAARARRGQARAGRRAAKSTAPTIAASARSSRAART